MKAVQYNKLTDPELVARCLEGQSEAWEVLIARYRRLIYSIPNKFRFTPADCDDVFQTVVVKLLEHLADLKDESKVNSWLITTTIRHCIQVRSLKQRDVSDEEGLEAAPDPARTTEEVHIQVDREQKIRESIRSARTSAHIEECGKCSTKAGELLEVLILMVGDAANEPPASTLS